MKIVLCLPLGGGGEERTRSGEDGMAWLVIGSQEDVEDF
jgi:hypothetical protein